MITELPDDILIHVLTLVRLKEAGRTSVLSKRWRYIWAYSPVLKFDSLDVLIGHDWYEGQREALKYLSWVDKVLNTHKALIIDEFRVRFDILLLGRINGSNNTIDNWIRFAMEKRVKMLEIDLSLFYHGVLVDARYTFPGLSSCNSLTSLELGCVDIAGETLESFLCNCQSLEYLSVKYSNSLVRLKVSSHSLHLKHLIIFGCYQIKDLEISAPNLVFVSYDGPKICVQFENTPKLAEVIFGSQYANDLTNMSCNLSRYVSQIKVVSLNSWLTLTEHSYFVKGSFLFTGLEKLDVFATANQIDDDLYCFTSLLKGCPSLQHFKIRLNYNVKEVSRKRRREQSKPKVCPHDHMKIVEIVGFVGYKIDLEFVMYLMECSTSLDKIILDTRGVGFMISPMKFVDPAVRRKARERAELLRANLNLRTKLEII